MTREKFANKLTDCMLAQLSDDLGIYNAGDNIEIVESDDKVTTYDTIEQAFEHMTNGCAIGQLVDDLDDNFRFMIVLDDRSLIPK